MHERVKDIGVVSEAAAPRPEFLPGVAPHWGIRVNSTEKDGGVVPIIYGKLKAHRVNAEVLWEGLRGQVVASGDSGIVILEGGIREERLKDFEQKVTIYEILSDTSYQRIEHQDFPYPKAGILVHHQTDGSFLDS